MSNASWMYDMGSQIGNRKLRQIALPGTHDSGTYDITPLSSFSTDDNGKELKMVDDAFIYGAAILSPFPVLEALFAALTLAGINDVTFRMIVASFSKTQSMSVGNQLKNGIRYFDLRVCLYSDDKIYTCHSMLGSLIDDILNDVKQFLADNPHEIVLLDFNHFYSFTSTSHQTLIDKIKSVLGTKLVPSTISEGLDVTPNQLWGGNGRVIVFYGSNDSSDDTDTQNQINMANQTAASNPSLVWPSNRINSDWLKDVDDLTELYSGMQGEFSNTANDGKFWVNQGIISPEGYVTYLLHNITGSLYEVAQAVTPAVTEWIKYLWAGSNPALNIVIVNFFELANYVDAFRALNQSPNSVWLASTSPNNSTVIPNSLYADTTVMTCPPTETVIGIQFQQSSYLSGHTVSNRLVPVVITKSLDGSGVIRNHYNSVNNSDYVGTLNNLYLDTTPLTVPTGKRLIGFQFVQSSTSQGFQVSNRLVPVLICADPDGQNQVSVCNKVNNSDYIAMTDLPFVTAPLSVPEGGEITGFQLLQTSTDSGFAIGGQIAPALLYDQTLTAATQATWSSASKNTSSAIQESDKDNSDAGIWFDCPQSELMVGRKHNGDENGDTYYYTAPVVFSGNDIQHQTNSTSSAITESSGSYYRSDDGCVMTGRWHAGDENGSTEYKDGSISCPNQSSAVVVVGPRKWTPNIKESNSDYTCPANCVLTGRWHSGDENGNTRYEYAPIFVVEE